MQIEIVFDIIASASLVFGIVVALCGYHKWDMVRRESRARFLFELINKFREDTDIKSLVYATDHGCDIKEISEAQKDKTLTYMAYICHLRKMCLISDEEYGFFEYEITRVMQNEQIRDYLKFMEEFGRRNGRSPFSALYGLKQSAR